MKFYISPRSYSSQNV